LQSLHDAPPKRILWACFVGYNDPQVIMTHNLLLFRGSPGKSSKLTYICMYKSFWSASMQNSLRHFQLLWNKIVWDKIVWEFEKCMVGQMKIVTHNFAILRVETCNRAKRWGTICSGNLQSWHVAPPKKYFWIVFWVIMTHRS
jgi:hypothetical protein